MEGKREEFRRAKEAVQTKEEAIAAVLSSLEKARERKERATQQLSQLYTEAKGRKRVVDSAKERVSVQQSTLRQVTSDVAALQLKLEEATRRKNDCKARYEEAHARYEEARAAKANVQQHLKRAKKRSTKHEMQRDQLKQEIEAFDFKGNEKAFDPLFFKQRSVGLGSSKMLKDDDRRSSRDSAREENAMTSTHDRSSPGYAGGLSRLIKTSSGRLINKLSGRTTTHQLEVRV